MPSSVTSAAIASAIGISRLITTVPTTEPSVTAKTTSKPDILASACWPTTRSSATMMAKTTTDASMTWPMPAHERKNMHGERGKGRAVPSGSADTMGARAKPAMYRTA